MTETRTVFLLDDHPVFRLGLCALLSAQPDVRVVGEAVDGEDTLRQLRTRPTAPDLLVVDLSLPGMGSLELLRQVRSHWPSIRILVLSTHDQGLFAQRALRMGVVGCVLKDEGPASFTRAISDALSADPRPMLDAVPGSGGRGHDPVTALSDRELDVFRLTGKGLATREIGERLRISVKTVETHKAHIKSKLSLRHAADLARAAVSWVEQSQRSGAA